MDLDTAALYRAVESRDRRFEGRFVLGVVTTGIYCRPGCPARIPRRENVRFYASAAAAEGAGFRACLRCRPETAPGAPARLGTATTVARALRLIEGGRLDGAGVGDLASSLGVGERHLRRLFAEHLGASPIAIARSRRAHFARKLCDETDLPMTEIAIAAGFSSIRRFNDEVRAAFGRPPSELRRARRAEPRAGAIALRLAFAPPYDWDAIASFLAARAIPGVEVVSAEGYRRTIAIDGMTGVIEVRPAAGRHLELRADAALSRALYRIVERVQRLFDLGADPATIGEHLCKDRALAPAIAARPGLRVPGCWDPFELAVRAVLGQQVSVKGATTLSGRLVEAFGEPLPSAAGAGLTHLFPSAARLAEADVASIGLPRARAATIRALARAVESGALDLAATRGPDEAAAALGAIPGIGPWTVAYVSMRAFDEPDAFPASDLGVRKGLARGGDLPSAREVEALAEAWRPWRAYAAMHLWTADHGSIGEGGLE